MESQFVRTLLLNVAVMIIAGHSIAQDFANEANTSGSLYPKRLISKIELLVGPSYIRPRGSDFFEDILDTKFGFNAAVGLSHDIGANFELTLKFGYEDKGYRFEVYQENYDYTPPAKQRSITDNTLHYVTCSISPRYTIDEKRHFYISTGPYTGYLINQSLSNEIYIDGELISKSGARGFKSDDYQTFDFGITSLVGYNLDIRENLRGTIQLNYNFGLSDVLKPSSSMKNTTYGLLLGITIIK